jgi:hypothetical protein
MGNVVPLAVEVDCLLRPQGPQHRDLLSAAASAGVEVLAQRVVLHLVPTYPNAKPQAAATEHIYLGSLLGD